MDKTVLDHWNTELQDDHTGQGGVAFIGETLGDFASELQIPENLPIRRVNNILQENGIQPIEDAYKKIALDR